MPKGIASLLLSCVQGTVIFTQILHGLNSFEYQISLHTNKANPCPSKNINKFINTKIHVLNQKRGVYKDQYAYKKILMLTSVCITLTYSSSVKLKNFCKNVQTHFLDS